MNVYKKVLSAAAITASAMIGIVALAENVAGAQDTAPRANITVAGGIVPIQSKVIKVIPATRSTELRTAMQRLTVSEQKIMTRALNKLTPEERRVLAKAINGSVSSGSTDLTPPTPPLPPNTPLNPTSSSRTGQGSSGTGTLPPR